MVKRELVLCNTLRQSELQISRLEILLIYDAEPAMLKIFLGIAIGSFWSRCEFFRISL
jgi:hypothetical protein